MQIEQTIKKYDTYKDSGIDWIGEIPSDWNITRLKFITDFKNGLAHEKEMDVEGKYCVINSKFVSQEGKVRFYCNEQIMPVYKNDICIVLSDVPNGKAYAKCYIVEEDDCYSLNQRIGCFYNIKINQKFFYYYLNRSQGLLLFDDGINQTNLRKPDLLNLPFLLPKEQEQQRIADYLDKKCVEIDWVVETEKVVIEKLKEYKQSIITEAVTKGLDKSVSLKDSGIEWIGKIPQHWEVWKLSRLSKQIIDGTHSTPTYTQDGIPFLRVTDISALQNRNDEIDFENVMHIPTNEHEELIKRCKPEKGDLLVSKNGSIGIPKIINWDSPFSIFVSLCLIKVSSKVTVEYLYYYFRSTLIWTEIAIGGKTGTITNLHLDKIKEFKIPLPNIDEQKSIVEYLDKKCSEIDKAIADKEQVIEKFTEYKKSLIYECVTGKRKVV